MMEIEQPDFMKRHLTVPELAKAWHISKDVVRSWFIDDPEVIKFGVGKLTKNRRRSYINLRIPPHVARRVYLRHTGRAWN